MKIVLLLAVFLCSFGESPAAETVRVNRADVRNLAAYLVTTSADMEAFARGKGYGASTDRIKEVKMAAQRLKTATGPQEDTAYWAARYFDEVTFYYARAREAVVREADSGDAAFIRGNLSSVIHNLMREFDETPHVRHVLGMDDGFGLLPYETYVWDE